MVFKGKVTAAKQVKTNILFIVGIDMGYACVGVRNCKVIPKLNLILWPFRKFNFLMDITVAIIGYAFDSKPP